MENIKKIWTWFKRTWRKSYGYGWVLVIFLILILVGLTVNKSDRLQNKEDLIHKVGKQLMDEKIRNNTLISERKMLDSLLVNEIIKRNKRDAELIKEIQLSQQKIESLKTKTHEKINTISSYNNDKLRSAFAEFE